jgi:dethiobiotin synthetase
MTIKLFIAGTDTGIGKTWICAGLLKAFNQLGMKTLGIKPLASGYAAADKLYNEDTLLHQEHAAIKLPAETITPILFSDAIAPHLAAQLSGRNLSVDDLNQQAHEVLNHPADISVIEGCGGWYVPLNSQETMADFVAAHHFKVMLVVGMRLGCLNHSLLTYRAMLQDGVNVIGWIANCLDPEMKYIEENIDTLKEWLPIPCLGIVPYGKNPEEFIAARKILMLCNK